MSHLAVEAFISMIETLDERRSGLERRVSDIGNMEERRSGEDRRNDFEPLNRPTYVKKCLSGIFDEYMRDRGRRLPIPLKTDGHKIINGPTDILRDWLGWDFDQVDLASVYVHPERRQQLLESVNENEFTRFFPHVYKITGEKIVLDVLITVLINQEGVREYLCFVGIAD